MKNKSPLTNDQDFEEVQIDIDEPIYSSTVVCRVLRIPVWTLKSLVEHGLVNPSRKTKTESRLYSKRELKRVQHCWYYISEQGVKIKSLKIILRLEKELEEK